jgi:hypothetical protein
MIFLIEVVFVDKFDLLIDTLSQSGFELPGVDGGGRRVPSLIRRPEPAS